MKIDDIECHTHVRELFKRLHPHNAKNAYLAVRKPVTTLRQLRDKLQLMTEQELDKPAVAQIKMHSYLKAPTAFLTHLEIKAGPESDLDKTVLHMSTSDLALAQDSDIAVFIVSFCKACKAWMEQDAINNAAAHEQVPSEMAKYAVAATFPVSDWQAEVTNGSCMTGYYAWALAQALESQSVGNQDAWANRVSAEAPCH